MLAKNPEDDRASSEALGADRHEWVGASKEL